MPEANDEIPAPLVRTRGDRRTLEFAPGDIQSEMLLSHPDALVLAYTRAMMGFVLFVPDPRHIVVVGLGGGSLVKFCHRHFPRARLTVIEVRADVIALRDRFGVPPDDDRLRVVHADATRHIAHMAQSARMGHPADRADVLLVDGFDAAGLPAALATPTFYHDCKGALRPGGVLAANVFTYDPRCGGVLADLERAFEGHTCWFDKVAGNNRIVFALRTPAPERLLRRVRRLARRRGLGLGPLNRLASHAVVTWIAARSILRSPS